IEIIWNQLILLPLQNVVRLNGAEFESPAVRLQGGEPSSHEGNVTADLSAPNVTVNFNGSLQIQILLRATRFHDILRTPQHFRVIAQVLGQLSRFEGFDLI